MHFTKDTALASTFATAGAVAARVVGGSLKRRCVPNEVRGWGGKMMSWNFMWDLFEDGRMFKYQCFLFVLVILSFNVILFEPVINMCSLSFVGLCCFCSCCCCCCWVVLLLVLVVVVVATVVEKITLSSCTISTLLVLGCCCSLCSGGRKWCDWLPAIVHPLWAWGLGQL